MNAEHLLTHFDRLTDAPDAIPRLRRFILDLAVRGKLVEQDPKDEQAEELLEEIEADRCNRAGSKRTRRTIARKKIVREEAPYPIPEIWVWAPLGYLTISRDGERIPVSKEERNGMAKVYDYYGASGVIDKVDNYLFDKPLLLIGEDGANLINRSTPIAFIARGKYWVNNHAHVLDGFSEDFLRYVELFINATDLKPYVTGTAQPKMNQARMNSIPVALPPLAEQHRIVAKVDDLIALCDRLETERKEREATRDQLVAASCARLNAPDPDPAIFQNHAAFALNNLTPLTTRPDQIKALRQTILNLAVRGKLVEQDPEDEPAGEALSRLREGTRNKTQRKVRRSEEADGGEVPFGCPEGWTWTTVQQTLTLNREISYGVIKLGDEPKSGGIPTLRCSDVRPGFINLSSVRKVHETIEAEYVRTRLSGGEVVINIRGTLGGVALVPANLKGFNVAREVAVVPIAQEISGPFMVYLMLSPYFWDHIQNNLRGIAYKGLNLGLLRDFPIPLPPLAEQHRIVAKVDELMAVCDRLEASLVGGEETRGRLVEAVLYEALAPVVH